ncbi:MAG: peptidylprolyl isomerase [Clostridia bacterium]|nr:peptidylprolyl isomerase [Clostridia bacterium]
MAENTKVKVEMENGGTFTIELLPEFAPETAANFERLAREGFYDGVVFHRVIDDFMAQGGDPTGTGMGGSGTNIRGEFLQNGFAQNKLSHERGVVSMARSMDPNSASSQFFICYANCTFLDGQYAAFGKVVEGMETVDEFLKVERRGPEGGTPVEPIRMKKVTVL